MKPNVLVGIELKIWGFSSIQELRSTKRPKLMRGVTTDELDVGTPLGTVTSSGASVVGASGGTGPAGGQPSSANAGGRDMQRTIQGPFVTNDPGKTSLLTKPIAIHFNISLKVGLFQRQNIYLCKPHSLINKTIINKTSNNDLSQLCRARSRSRCPTIPHIAIFTSYRSLYRGGWTLMFVKCKILHLRPNLVWLLPWVYFWIEKNSRKFTSRLIWYSTSAGCSVLLRVHLFPAILVLFIWIN